MSPRLLAASAAALALCLAAPAGASAAACTDTDVLPAADTMPAVATATVCLLNEERAARGLSPVTENPALTKASLAYSQRLVAESFFAHEAPDGSDVVDRLTTSGYIRPSSGWEVGENLAWAQGVLASPRNVVQAWMDSPGHRDNILTRGYREIGIGIVLGTPTAGPDGSTFTTNFGRRDADPTAGDEGFTGSSVATKPATATKASRAATTAKVKANARARKAAKRRAAVRRARAAKAARAARAARSARSARASGARR